jgi:hypothetical protein
MTNPQPAADHTLLERLRGVSIPARKLFAVIVREAYHGPIHPKEKGTATPPEILEACGLDVADFYALLKNLQDAQLIEISSSYPFEEIRLTPGAAEAESVAARCLQQKTPLEDAFVNLTFAAKN